MNTIEPVTNSLVILLCRKLQRYTDFSEALGLLLWDQEVMMPVQGTARRSAVVSTLTGELHEEITDPEIERIVSDAENLPAETLNTTEKAVLRNIRHAIEVNKKLSRDFVEEFSELRVKATASWQKAKQGNDFSIFASDLEKIVEYNLRYAEYKGYSAHPYNALLEDYQIGLDLEQVQAIFNELTPALRDILTMLPDQRPPLELVQGRYKYADEKVMDLSRFLMRRMGLTESYARIDQSAHPFSQTLNPGDARITTKLNPHDFTFAMTAVMHESGHALYNTGVSSQLAGTGLDTLDLFLGVHESQSRLWENQVGRSREFAEFIFPILESFFPWLSGYGPQDIFNLLNYVHPSLIRTESDEITYNLHIALRFEIEMGLLDGKIKVADLPEIWNEKMQEYVGVKPDSDSVGVLQDIHWAHGTIGYFPSYTIGNVYAAQLFATYQLQYPGAATQIRQGEFISLRNWLKEHVHQYGMIHLPEELMINITGSKPSPKYLIEYLRSKYLKVGSTSDR